MKKADTPSYIFNDKIYKTFIVNYFVFKLNQGNTAFYGQQQYVKTSCGIITGAWIKSVRLKVTAIHCMLHWQELASKTFEPDLHSVLNTAVAAYVCEVKDTAMTFVARRWMLVRCNAASLFKSDGSPTFKFCSRIWLGLYISTKINEQSLPLRTRSVSLTALTPFPRLLEGGRINCVDGGVSQYQGLSLCRRENCHCSNTGYEIKA
ncbi:hypothetical protein JOB18_034586 [Solea senegalensis]|uniref:Peptidase S1 domain-containing protein n=1 Tax=Solea senegalensis TaxID=28829 RepID=A0AAV6S7V8_SOLSE|nr:hypothetical protein JOB18_034586 [Solea senegalensis]